MPGPEDLTQRLLWLGATQSLCARAEESGASAEIVELHQNDLALDSLCHPPKPESVSYTHLDVYKRQP